MTEFKHVKVPREQYDTLVAALEAGFTLESDPDKIKARYKAFDFAEQVPRVIMYMDIGALLGRIDALTLAIHEAGLTVRE